MHPNLKANIHKYEKDSYYILPTWHGCGKKRNRNGTNKEVNYRIGDMCSKASYKKWWKDVELLNFDIQPNSKIYFTRFMHELGMNKLAKNKGYCWYDWEKKIYRPKSDWYKVKDKNRLQGQEFVHEKGKKIGELIKNSVVRN